MSEELKKNIIESLKKQLPGTTEERIDTLLGIILLQIDSYNTCGKAIDYQKLQQVITEVLYQMLNNELNKTVTSIRRGDTTLGYADTQAQVVGLLAGYDSLIKDVIGCGGLVFY